MLNIIFINNQTLSYKNTLHSSFFDICQNSNKALYKDNENLKRQLNFNFLTNDVKGLQSTKKRLKLFNFLKNKISPKGILFLQETHSSLETEKKWIDDFKDKICYSYSKTNLYGVLIAFYGNLNICFKNKVNDNDGRVLILESPYKYIMSMLKKNS